MAFVDAPVVGSRGQAEAGQLVHLAGGEPEAVERARGVLLPASGVLHHVGPSGAGATLKLAVNGLFAAQLAMLGETLGLLRQAGVDPARAAEVLGGLPISSPAAKGAAAAMLEDRHAPMFPVALVAKDMDYASGLARAAGVHTPVLDAVAASYRRAQEAGLGELNITGVARLSSSAEG